MTQTPLRVLFIEATDNEIQQSLALLAQSNFIVDFRRVEHATALQEALADATWDIVLCSYNPPAFGGLEALRLMQSMGLSIPFLFLAHNAREESIIEAIQAGAGDFLFKGNLSRLVPAVEHFLGEAKLRDDNRRMLQELHENQSRLQALIANLPGLVFQILQSNDGSFSFPYISDGCQPILGILPAALQQKPETFSSLLHSADIASWQNSLKHSSDTLTTIYWEGRLQPLKSDTSPRWVSLRGSPRRVTSGTQWECVMFDISERKQAEIDILHSQEQLRELSAHIEDVREQERLALAREVHDDMGSLLTAIKFDIAWLSGKMSDSDPALKAKISDIESLVSKCAAAASNISRNLRPSALDSFGIVAAVEIEAGEFAQRTGIPCHIETADEGASVDPSISISLFRILQEALNNIVKHSHASKVQVKIHNYAGWIELRVSDNGRGLQSADRLKPRSFGLRGIQERVERFGGEVSINGESGKGSTISVRIPHGNQLETSGQTHQRTLF